MSSLFYLSAIFLTALAKVTFFKYYGKEEAYAQVNPQIYQKGESPNSPGVFRYQRARKTNFRIIQKNSQR